jgi:hypothetical protein
VKEHKLEAYLQVSRTYAGVEAANSAEAAAARDGHTVCIQIVDRQTIAQTADVAMEFV